MCIYCKVLKSVYPSVMKHYIQYLGLLSCGMVALFIW